ncbi:MAG: ATP-grasp domain-containing protein [Coriobacteriales bacterium]|jgi:biotin carboxylase
METRSARQEGASDARARGASDVGGETAEGHRLLVLGSMDEFVGLVDMARARGYRTFVADGYPDGPAKSHADAAYDVDVRDVDALVELAESLEVDGAIASFSDVLFESLCRLTHAADLYSYCPLDGMAKLRDKRLMGDMFSRLGVPTPASRVVHAASVENDLAGLSFPCVMKPVNGYGSYGIFVVRSPEEVREHFAQTAGVGKDPDAVLVEEYDEGPEINMIAWVAAGRVHAISLADREKCPLVECGVPDVVRITYPSVWADDAAAAATDVLQRVADDCGILDGPLSMQFFWHPQDRTLAVCEVAGRVLGYEHENVQIGSGLSIEELLLDLTYDRERGRELVGRHSLSDFEGVSFVLNFHALPGCTGVVGDISEAREILARPEALAPSMLHYRVGERVGHGKGARPYVARVFCHTDTREQADALTAELFRSFSVRGTEGEELVCRESLPFMREWHG